MWDPLSSGILRRVGYKELPVCGVQSATKAHMSRLTLFWVPQHWRCSSCHPDGRHTVVFNKLLKINGKGKGNLRTGHKCPEEKQSYSSTLSLTSARDGGWLMEGHVPADLPPRRRPVNPLYRRLCGPQDRSGRVRKISPSTGIRSPDRPAHGESLHRLRWE